jgi:Flp pilus assembly secretin CpaC
VIGNPLVADITLQPGGIIIVTGKSYGATNFVAMDRNGEVLLDRIILVESAADPVVTVHRGIERETYSCMPICQPRITLGDSERFFKSALDQAGVLSGQAAGAAASKPQ